MGRKHGRHNSKRKRKRTIDLNALSKKQRREYRNDQHTVRNRKSTLEKEDEDKTDKTKEQVNIDTDSSDNEINPYSQLVSSLSMPGHKYKYSDEESGSDDEEEVEEEVVVGGELTDENDELLDQEGTGDDDNDSRSSGSEQVESEESRESEEESEDERIAERGKSEKRKSSKKVEDEDESDIEVIEVDEDPDEFSLTDSDPFRLHFETDIPEDFAEKLGTKEQWPKKNCKVPCVGSAVLTALREDFTPTNRHRKEKDLRKLCVKHKLCAQVSRTNLTLGKVELVGKQDMLTAFQLNLFSVINNYQDILYSERTFDNGEEIRLLYCLHALNHVLKTRSRIIAHNTKIKQKGGASVEDDYRDQGLTRPKVLIVVPFRDSALKIANMMMSLIMPTDQSFVTNKKRFQSEYGLSEEVKTGAKSDDFEATFAGNIDDHFRIGIGVAKKSLKLYTQFYSADIILASPLGLRTLIGAEGEKERDYEFLSSIELLILDQADIFLMQNWDHVMHLMNHLHLQPKAAHGADFSRVRMWNLNGWSKYYRQNLVFSSVMTPEITALFNKMCHNYAGKLQFNRTSSAGTICQIVVQLPQVFHRIDSTSYSSVPDDRFDFFVKKILPEHKDKVMSQTFIYVASYFDFVRLRNYFKKEELDFVHINEYCNDKQISRARNRFFHRKAHFMLFTDRFHFYKRYRIRGIHYLVFYGLPQYPRFYSEVCNMVQESTKSAAQNSTCTVLYSKYEAQKLAEIVGTDRAGHMIGAEKNVHMFVTGENG